MRVVFDTSVLVAAARSRLGASFALINSIPSPTSSFASPSVFIASGSKC